MNLLRRISPVRVKNNIFLAAKTRMRYCIYLRAGLKKFGDNRIV